MDGLVLQPRFRVLGPLRVLGPSGEALALGGRRPRELLALLLLHDHAPLSTERIVDALWGESASAGAATTLRTHVAAVRRVLAAAGAPEALVTRPGGYALDLDPADLDAELFERQVQRGQEALGLGDAARAADVLRAALELWTGEPLADLGPPDFATGSLARLEELRLAAEEAAAAAELELGRHAGAVGRLQTLVARHPFRERLVAQLVLALYRSGRQADALATYAATRERLADELGLDPGPELQALETAMLRQDPLLLGPAGDRPAPVGPRVTAARPPDAVLTALRRAPIVGRDPQLLALSRGWDAVVDGGSSVVLVSGPAGIGKSRLVAELAHTAGEVGTVLVARCDDPSVPYRPLAAALRTSAEVAEALHRAPAPVRERLSPLLGDATGDRPAAAGPGSDVAFLHAVGWLVAAVAPLLLVVEEAERIDAASAALVRHLARDPGPRSMLVVSYRDPPGSDHPPLRELLGDRGVGDLATRIALEPLRLDDLVTLVSEVTDTAADPDLAEQLWRRTGGNPFFVSEVLRDLPDDRTSLRVTVPASVRDVLRDRLSTLPTATRDAVGAAAVLGGDVDLLLLGGMVDRTEDQLVDDLVPAVARGFLVESGRSWVGGYAFPHDLMREAVYAELPPPARERLHRRAADALLAARTPGDDDVVAAAAHLQRSGRVADPLAVADASRHAAEVAARGLAWTEAVHHAEAALPHLDRAAGHVDRADARVSAALLRLRSGHDHARALALLDEALALQLEAGDTAAASTTHSRIGGALVQHHSVMDVPRALQHLDDAERLDPAVDGRFHLHRGRMQAGVFGLHLDVLERASARARHLARSSGRRDLAANAAWGAGYLAADRGDPTAALAHLEEAWRAAHSLGDPYLAWPPAHAAAHLSTELFLDPGTGRAWCRAVLAQPRFGSFADPHEAVVDQMARAMAAMGDLGDAVRAASGLSAGALAHRVLAFYAGDWERAAQQARESMERDQAAGNRHDALFNARALAEALVLLGDTAGCAGVLEEALAVAVAGGQLPSEVWLRARLAQLGVEASGHVARCDGAVTGDGWGGVRGEVALARAVAAGAGRPDEVAAACGEAVATFATYHLPWRRAEAHLVGAGLLAEAGDVRGADTERARARALYERLGAGERWLGRCGVPGAAGSTRSQRPSRTVGS